MASSMKDQDDLLGIPGLCSGALPAMAGLPVDERLPLTPVQARRHAALCARLVAEPRQRHQEASRTKGWGLCGETGLQPLGELLAVTAEQLLSGLLVPHGRRPGQALPSLLVKGGPNAIEVSRGNAESLMAELIASGIEAQGRPGRELLAQAGLAARAQMQLPVPTRTLGRSWAALVLSQLARLLPVEQLPALALSPLELAASRAIVVSSSQISARLIDLSWPEGQPGLLEARSAMQRWASWCAEHLERDPLSAAERLSLEQAFEAGAAPAPRAGRGRRTAATGPVLLEEGGPQLADDCIDLERAQAWGAGDIDEVAELHLDLLGREAMLGALPLPTIGQAQRIDQSLRINHNLAKGGGPREQAALLTQLSTPAWTEAARGRMLELIAPALERAAADLYLPVEQDGRQIGAMLARWRQGRPSGQGERLLIAWHGPALGPWERQQNAVTWAFSKGQTATWGTA